MAYADILATQKAAVAPLDLTLSKRDTLLSMQANIVAAVASSDNITDSTATLFNDLDARLTTLVDQPALDVAEVNDLLTAIKAVQSEGLGDNFIKMFQSLYNELNDREVSVSQEVLVVASNGILEVDLSAHGFATTGDYNIQLTSEGTRAVHVSYDKVSATMVRINVRDSSHWEFDEGGVASLLDCSVTPLKVTIMVSKQPVQLSATITEADGDIALIGAAVPVIAAPTISVVGDANNIVTATGTVAAGLTVTVTFPDGQSITGITGDVNGNYSAISLAAVAIDGSVTAQATDGTYTSVTAIAEYVATVANAL